MAELLDYIKSVLRRVANVQINYPFVLGGILILFSLLMAAGATQITLQSDLSELDPQDIPVTQLRNKIATDFNEFESVVILIELDDSEERKIQDIRDPRVIEFIQELHMDLEENSLISRVSSAAFMFENGPPETLDESVRVIQNTPGSKNIFSRGYEWTTIFIEADVGGDSEKIRELNEQVADIIAAANKPGGVRVVTTGDAPLNSTIFTLLISDAFFTMLFSTILIYILVVLIQGSFKKALIIITPLILGILWALGTMGWLSIPITVATAAMGAMLLGLGVEYSIFLFSRFDEELHRHTVADASKRAVTEVGSTLVSSGTTTLLGFLALSLSVFPVLSDLGKTLAIGIFYMLASTIIASPLIIMLTTKKDYRRHSEAEEKREAYMQNIYNAYAGFVSRRPGITLVLALLATAGMIYSTGLIIQGDVDFETILPDDIEEMIAFVKLTDEFGDDSSILVHISLDPQEIESDEITDIRDRRVLVYIQEIEGQLATQDYVVSTSSLVDFTTDESGRILQNQEDIRQRLENPFASDLLSRGYESTLLRITVSEDALDNSEVVIADIRELIESKPQVPGTVTRLSGSLIVQSELDGLNGPDSARTSMIAFAAIVVFLFILSRSIKSTVVPLITVILGIIWTLGLTGMFRIPFNNISSSVITMTIGIGIDFGLQVMNRYNQERHGSDKREAMKHTLVAIMTPMVITVIAAVIGFRAMGLGQLKIMGDLGILMSFGIVASMIVSITAVASIILLTDRKHTHSSIQNPKKEEIKK